VHVVLCLTLLLVTQDGVVQTGEAEVDSVKVVDKEMDFWGFQVSYFVPSFVIDEYIWMNTAYGRLPVHFFTSGFRQTLGWGGISLHVPKKLGVGGNIIFFGHHSTGRLNWEMRDLGVSLPSNRCEITEGGFAVEAYPSFTRGPVSAGVFAGGVLALSMFDLDIADTTESGGVYMLALDFGARALVRVTRGFGITAGYAAYLPWVWGCSVEENVTFHPRYVPYEVSFGLCWGG